MYALIKDGAIARYPYTGTDLILDNPGTSFPAGPLPESVMLAFDAVPVVPTERPACDAYTQRVDELEPAHDGGRWVQRWAVRDATQDEKNGYAAQRFREIVSQAQARLDAFARTRNYDGILSLCTYATSPTAKFKAEGQYGVTARDATWAKLYAMLAEVQAGTRPMPNSYADIEPELPALAWPA